MSYAKLEFEADEEGSDDEQDVEDVNRFESGKTSYTLDTNIIELHEIENKTNQIEIILDEEPNKQPTPSFPERVKKIVKTHWFIICLFAVILLAYLVPWYVNFRISDHYGILCLSLFRVANKNSPIHTPVNRIATILLILPQILVNYIAIPFAFVCSGISLPTNQILKSFLKIKFHVFTLFFVFVLFPLMMYGYTSILEVFSFNRTLRIGMAIMSAFPTTGATCVLLTKTAHGDDASALFTATLSNILGVFVSPTILYLLLNSTVEISFVRVISNLMVTIMLPLTIGQIIQKILQKVNENIVKKIPTGIISNCLILFIVFTVFCDSFSSNSKSLTFATVILTLFLMAVFFGLFSAIAFGTTALKFLKFSRSERVAFFYVSAQKTLGMGLPIIRLIYGNSPETSLVALPILVYHPTQLIVGSFFTGIFTKWVAGAAPDFVPMSASTT